MGKIVAIGGGHIGTNGTLYETEKADIEIVRLAEKAVPSVLYIGFANQNNLTLQNRIREIFEDQLHCRFHVLEQSDLKVTGVINSKIDHADIIYVSGGDSFLLMEIISRSHLAEALTTAYIKGKVLCGISAGALCWFKYGCSILQQQNVDCDTTAVPHCVFGMGIVDFLLCPHYHDPKRKRYLRQILERTQDTFAIGIDHAALIVDESVIRIIPLLDTAIAHKLYYNGKSVAKTPLLLNHKYSVEDLCDL